MCVDLFWVGFKGKCAGTVIAGFLVKGDNKKVKREMMFPNVNPQACS
jgi:hypothetical protein